MYSASSYPGNGLTTISEEQKAAIGQNLVNLDFIKENGISFKREKKGLFRKVETLIERDIHTNQIVKQETIESDELYRQTLSDDFDHELVFDNADGTEARMRLKVVDSQEWLDS